MKTLVYILLLVSLLFSKDDFQEIKNLYYKSYNYEYMGKYKEAVKVLAPIYKKYPTGYTLNLRFAWLFYLSKKYTDALKYYKKASLLNSYATDPKLGMIRIYLTIQDYKNAQMIAYQLLKIDYYNYYANLYAIKALIAQKKYTIATTIIKKMLSLYPTNIAYLEELYKIYLVTNSPHTKKLKQDILILDPNNVLVHKKIK